MRGFLTLAIDRDLLIGQPEMSLRIKIPPAVRQQPPPSSAEEPMEVLPPANPLAIELILSLAGLNVHQVTAQPQASQEIHRRRRKPRTRAESCADFNCWKGSQAKYSGA